MATRIRIIFVSTVLFLIGAVSCEQIDEATARLTALEDRVSALEQLCSEMNSNISSLQGLVTAVQSGDFITSVSPLIVYGQEVGYTITFVKSNPIVIYHGKDGYWYVSTDNGQTWSQLGRATGADGQDGRDGVDGRDGTNGTDGKDGRDGVDGKDGDSMFQSIDYSTSNEYVVFTLSNATVIKIPTWYAFEQLKTLCNQMNSNIESLQTIVAAYQEANFITSVLPLVENGIQIGYTISFSNGESIVVYHGKEGQNGADGRDGKDGTDGQDGKDGADGHTPVIGVRQDTDGIWYWTLDGDWLLDADNNKVKAVGLDGKDGKDGQDGQDGQPGADGKDGLNGTDGRDGANGQDGRDGTNGQDGVDGKDGVTPQLKIEDGYWCVSTDNGQTWSQLGKATGADGKDGRDGVDGRDGTNGTDGKDGRDGVDGKDGDSMFQSVSVTDTEVTFVTSDGQTFIVKRAAALSIDFESADLVVMGCNSTRDIRYTITSGFDHITIEALSSADIKVKVVKADSKTGALQVKTGATIDEYSKVVVLVSNGSQALMRTLNFEEAAIEVEENTTKEVSNEGGTVTLEFFSNMPCQVVIPEEAQSWISIAPETKAMTKQSIDLIVEPNIGLNRSAIINVVGDGDASNIVLSYTITQEVGGVWKEGTVPPDNEIWYTTTDGILIDDFSEKEPFNTSVISHMYENGKGIIRCSSAIITIDGEGCDLTSLASISLPSRLQSIRNWTFYNCKKLNVFILNSFDYIQLSDHTFDDACLGDMELAVPKGYKNWYEKADYWKDFGIISESDYERKYVCEAVDLGLSVKWATCNLGALTPEDYGSYYAWGETVTKSLYESNRWYDIFSTEDSINGMAVLSLEYDVAHVKWGGDWRMPTQTEFRELINNCDWILTSQNGVTGYLITSEIEGYKGHSIFLPASGTRYGERFYYKNSVDRYWSSTRKDRYFAYTNTGDEGLAVGLPIRPVCRSENWHDNTTIALDMVSKTIPSGEYLQITATVSSNGKDVYYPVTWSSDNNSVASVDENGLVTAHSNGEAVIMASIPSKMVSCSITVFDEAEINHEYVDLGLSVKWATYNVGAVAPEDYGSYYAWGETEAKTDYSWITYNWCNGSSTTLTKYNTSSSYGPVDNKTVLDAEDDVAHVKWGGDWRMPTRTEFQELIDNCTWTWTTENGVNGYRITSNITDYTGRSIFLPAAGLPYPSQVRDAGIVGYYWSTNINTDYSGSAKELSFSSDNHGTGSSLRFAGYSIRPVCPSRIWPDNIKVSLDIETKTVMIGDKFTIRASVKKSGVDYQYPVKWTSDNSAVAVVNEQGEVSALSSGTVNITASVGSVSASCVITVVIDDSEVPREYVDLGLSVKWATYNVGAVAPEDYGNYYAWGETETKNLYNWSTYKWCEGSETTLTKYNNKSTNGVVDNKSVLDMEDDVVHMNWGGGWRMPTQTEFQELIENCTWTWTTENGVNGYRVASNKTGFTDRSIFFPAAGCRQNDSYITVESTGFYWSKSMATRIDLEGMSFSDESHCLYFRSSDNHIEVSDFYRDYGMAVRPVCN